MSEGFKDNIPSEDNALTYPIEGKSEVASGKFEVISTPMIFSSSSRK